MKYKSGNSQSSQKAVFSRKFFSERSRYQSVKHSGEKLTNDVTLQDMIDRQASDSSTLTVACIKSTFSHKL